MNCARIRLLVGAVALVLGFGGVGCATQNKQIQTSRFTLSHPDYWEVKSVGQNEGEATTVLIGQYGSAIIDEGSGAVEGRASNYESVQAKVEARIYAWDEPPGVTNPSVAVATLLSADPSLRLSRHARVPDQPQECGELKRKYDVLKTTQEPLDLVSRPGWRTIVVGGRANGTLVGVVARVESEIDDSRFCHNLSNMRVQLQNLLDGLSVASASNAPASGAANPAGASGAPAPGGSVPAPTPAPAPAPAPPGASAPTAAPVTPTDKTPSPPTP